MFVELGRAGLVNGAAIAPIGSTSRFNQPSEGARRLRVIAYNIRERAAREDASHSQIVIPRRKRGGISVRRGFGSIILLMEYWVARFKPGDGSLIGAVLLQSSCRPCAGIQVFLLRMSKTCMAGTSPAMSGKCGVASCITPLFGPGSRADPVPAFWPSDLGD